MTSPISPRLDVRPQELDFPRPTLRSVLVCAVRPPLSVVSINADMGRLSAGQKVRIVREATRWNVPAVDIVPLVDDTRLRAAWGA